MHTNRDNSITKTKMIDLSFTEGTVILRRFWKLELSKSESDFIEKTTSELELRMLQIVKSAFFFQNIHTVDCHVHRCNYWKHSSELEEGTVARYSHPAGLFFTTRAHVNSIYVRT